MRSRPAGSASRFWVSDSVRASSSSTRWLRAKKQLAQLGESLLAGGLVKQLAPQPLLQPQHMLAHHLGADPRFARHGAVGAEIHHPGEDTHAGQSVHNPSFVRS